MGSTFTPARHSFDAAFAAAIVDSASETREGHPFLVAESSRGAVVGYAFVTIARLFYAAGAAAQLHELVVDDEWRGHRVGTALVTAIERECRARGAVQLTVASLRGAAFYEGLGYRSTADYLKKSLDA